MAYNPQIEYRGDRYLFQGISDLGRAAGGAIREYRDNQRDSRAADAALETLVKSVSPWIESGKVPAGLAEEMGNLGKFSSLSTRAKQAKLGQYVSSLQMLLDEADRQDRATERADAASLRRSLFDLQKSESDRRLQREDATGRAVLGLAPMLDMPPDQAGGVMGPALVGALRENPEADALSILDAMTKAQRGRMDMQEDQLQGPLVFDEDPITGARFARGGRSVLPSGVNPEKMSDQAVQVLDGDGNVIAHRVGTASKPQFLRPVGQLTTRDRLALLEEKAKLVTMMPLASKPEDKAAIREQMADIDAELDRGANRNPTKASAPAEAPQRKRYNPSTGKVE